VATVGGISLAAVVLDDPLVLLVVAFVMIVFWLGVVVPAVWSRKPARRSAAQRTAAILLGCKDANQDAGDDQKAFDQSESG
jgi:type II secretory pathway component PulF